MQLLRIFGCQTMHNFVYLAQRRSQEFFCEPNFGVGPCPRAPWLRHWYLVCRYELDRCSGRVQTSNFLSATVLSYRQSSSHRGSELDTDKTVLSCLAWRCELAATRRRGVQGGAEKAQKQLEAQLAELNARLEQSAREISELTAVKTRAQAEIAEHGRLIEDSESQINQLTKLKQTLGKQLEEAKASLEEESRLRAKFQSEARNFQVAAARSITITV